MHSADFAVLCLFKATMPCNKVLELCPDGYDVAGLYPKLAALANRTAAFAAVKTYLESTSSMTGAF
jgi:hypothetical protein